MSPAPSLLAQPLTVGGHRLRNRIISAPMERNLATTDGLVTPAYIRYLEARAAGGAALIFTESSYVRADGKARRLQMGIHDDATIGPLSELAEAVHHHGALLGVELNHGGRTAQASVNGLRCVAPSPVPCEVAGGEVPMELEDEDIRHIIASYADAARRCEAAGVDVVMLHAAHGYLIHQFMSPRTNLRNDEWSSPIRFLREVIQAVRRAIPTGTLGIRLSALEGTADGLDDDRTLELMTQAPLDLLDFLDISAGSYEAGEWIVQPGEWEEGLLGRFAERYRKFGLPVSVAGRITAPETAEWLLQSGQADLVTVARALHADPGWAGAAVTGARYRPCIATNHCIDSLFTGEPVPCSVNPDVTAALGAPSRDQAGRTAVVVGAGPSGLEAARALAARGARVVLLEREQGIGGQVRLCAQLRTYLRYRRILDWYRAELERLGVVAQLATEATAKGILAEDPDVVVLATGGAGVLPDVEGITLPRVHEVRSWLQAGTPDLGSEQHVVWGADREGVAVADELIRRGKAVLIIGSQESLAPDVGRRAKILTIPRLTEHPAVEIMLGARIRAIAEESLAVESGRNMQRVPARGPVLVSQGLTPTETLRTALRDAGYQGPLRVAGDAAGDGADIAHAVSAGAAAARSVTHL